MNAEAATIYKFQDKITGRYVDETYRPVLLIA
jgi:hypothetical protein